MSGTGSAAVPHAQLTLDLGRPLNPKEGRLRRVD